LASSMSTAAVVLKPTYPSELSSLSKPMDSLKKKKSAYVEVIEQPAGKGLRFRYECEGRSAGSIPGAASTPEHRTFPTIRVVGYSGRAVVVVSCVSSEPPYRPHPHNLVGKEGCKKGVCTLELGEDMTCSFPSLGIQCVKKKDIEESLNLRQQIRVDPYQTGFSHKSNPSAVDLNCVRLAFQVFLEGNDQGAFTFALKPVVSDPIYDKKSKCDLTICRLTETSASVAGGKEILLFCDKITKDDIQVRFFEERGNQLVWEGFGDFQPADVHKQYGICFKTPKYKNIEIESAVTVRLQLRRPSDGAVSESRPFEFIPLDAGRSYWSAKRLKTNYTVFNQILSVDQQLHQVGEEQLRHKQPSRISGHEPAIVNIPPKEEGEMDIKMEAGIYRQQLNPVAMPGSGSIRVSQLFTPPTSSIAAQSAESLAPQVPIRSPHKSSLLQSGIPTLPNRQQQQQQQQLQQQQQQLLHPLQERPVSDLSMLSDFTQCDNTSIATRQSVNEILSMADVSVCSEEENLENLTNLDNINISLDYYLQQQGLLSPEQPSSSSARQGIGMRKEGPDYMGSLSSVTTVRENKAEQIIQPVQEPTSSTNTDTLPSSTNSGQVDSGLEAIYDDNQGLYDDVDMKYDDVQIMDLEPPVPPVRKRGLSVDRGAAEGLDKPLPNAPKHPSIIAKLSEKKNELLKEREKEAEKKKQLEEQKRKEKELLEEQKKKEKEEREKKKNEERERKRLEEEERKIKRKKEEEEKRQKANEIESEKGNQSLFQRLFQRNQSRFDDGSATDDVMLDTPPPVPAHAANPLDQALSSSGGEVSQGEVTSSPINNSFDPDISEIVQHMSQAGDLQRLDSVINEFTSQFPTDYNTNSSSNNNHQSNNSGGENNLTQVPSF